MEKQMLDQNIFAETVREVSEIIRTSATPLTREEILSYFKDMELNEEQQELVFSYFITPHEDPVEEVPEEPEEPQEEKEEEEAVKEQQAQSVLPESKMFQMYMEEIQGLPTYTKQELAAMYESLLNGEEKTVKILSNAWLGRVLKLAEKLAVSPDNFEDIVQEGNMSLFLKLSELCGAGKGIDVESELLAAVEQAMQASISEYAGEDDSESAMIGKVNLVNEAKKYLKEETGIEPGVKELAEYTKMAEEELADLLTLMDKAKKEGEK